MMIALTPESVASDASALVLCTGAPKTAQEALLPPAAGGAALAAIAMATGLRSVDYAVDDDASGRTLAVAAQNNVAVGSTGTANHVALLDIAAEPPRLLLVRALPIEIDMVESGTVALPAFSVSLDAHA